MIRAIHSPDSAATIARDYPAHLHINILSPGQGQGLGKALITRFCDRLREQNVSGLHFGVSARNTRAIGFYQHMGFEQLGKDEGGVILGTRF